MGMGFEARAAHPCPTQIWVPPRQDYASFSVRLLITLNMLRWMWPHLRHECANYRNWSNNAMYKTVEFIIQLIIHQHWFLDVQLSKMFSCMFFYVDHKVYLFLNYRINQIKFELELDYFCNFSVDWPHSIKSNYKKVVKLVSHQSLHLNSKLHYCLIKWTHFFWQMVMYVRVKSTKKTKHHS